MKCAEKIGFKEVYIEKIIEKLIVMNMMLLLL